jgi:zinc transport system substrate-binding protein
LQQAGGSILKKSLTFSIAALAVSLLAAGCAAKEAPATPAEGSAVLTVATSINPVDQVVKIVGGDLVSTWKIVPEGSEAHDFEPTIQDMGKLSQVNLLFINGLDMEPWVEKAVENSGNGKLQLVDLSTGAELIPLESEEGHTADDGHDHGEFDPHLWLSLDALMVMAENAEKALAEAAPDYAAEFAENLRTFQEAAQGLKAEYQEKFAPYEGKAFVTGHAAFAYLTRELGLVQKAVEGPFQEGEPTPKTLEELISFVKQEGIKTIFLEEQASPKVSETLARETGSTTVAINTLEAEGELLPTLKETYEKILKSVQP